MSDNDWKVLVDQLDSPALTLEARATAIADELRKGTPSKLFCTRLAAMIRPGGRNPTLFEFQLKHKKNGRPRKDVRIGLRMIELVDTEKLTPEAAIAKIQEKFGKRGNGRSQCLEALAKAREFVEQMNLSLEADIGQLPLDEATLRAVDAFTVALLKRG